MTSNDVGRNGIIIEGVERRRLNVFFDARGELGVLENGADLDFDIKRVFYIKVDDVDAVRAGHACSAAESIVAIAGSVTVDVDNGRESASEVVPAGARLQFTLMVLQNSTLSPKVLRTLFSYGRMSGLGQWRNAGWGQFQYELTAVDAHGKIVQ